MEAAEEDEEGDEQAMGPKFRAAEQSSQTEFQIFPVSLEGLREETDCRHLLSLDWV